MIRKPEIRSPKQNIMTGMIFFLCGITASLVADGKLIGAFLNNIIHEGSLRNALQGFADGFSVPMYAASIFFHLRGLVMQRLR